MRNRLLWLTAILFWCFEVEPAMAQWQRVDVMSDGSAPRALRFVHDTIYVATLYHGIWRSTDKGSTWSEVTSHSSGFDYDTIQEFFVDGKYMAAFSNANLLFSSDAGATWARTPRVASWWGAEYKTPLWLFGLRGNRVFTNQVEWHGPDLYDYYSTVSTGVNAQNWTSLWPLQHGTQLVAQGDSLFMANAAELYHSTDGGVHWSLNNSTCKAYIAFLGQQWVTAGTNRDILYSNNAGKDWSTPIYEYNNESVQGLQGLVRVGTLFACAATLYLGADRVVQLTISTNGGATWKLNGSLVPGSDVTLLVANDSNIFVGTEAGLYASADTGRTWHLFGPTESHGPPKLTSGHATPGAMICGSVAHGVLMSTDRGTTWNSRSTGLPAERVYSVTTSGSTLFAGLVSGLFTSDDAGTSWTRVMSPLLDTLKDVGVYGEEDALIVHSNSPIMEYPGVSNSAFLSTDGARNWSQITLPVAEIDYDHIHVLAGRVYLPSRSGLIMLDPTTRAIDSTQLDFQSIFDVCSPHAGTIVASGWTADQGSPLTKISTDGGASWAVIAMDIYWPRFLASLGDVLFSTTDRTTFGTSDWLLRSDDLGRSWWPFSEGYSGTYGRGIWEQNGMLFVLDLYSLYRREIGPPNSIEPGGIAAGIPHAAALEQNYPNPFNPLTTIRYALPQRSHMTLKVYSLLGQAVAMLVNDVIEAGYHEVQFDGSGLASGVYFYRLQAGGYTETKALCLVR